MTVMIDDQPLAAEQLGFHTVGQVLSHIQKENRLVVHLLIDGAEPDLSQIGSLRKSKLADHTLYVETAEPRRMALDVLGDIEQHLSQTDEMRGDCVRLLESNHHAKAFEKLRGCFNAWSHAQESILKTAQLLRIDLVRIIVNGHPFSELMQAFAEQLRSIKSSLENRDYVSLIDALLYDTADTTTQWRSAIAEMRTIIGA